MRLHDGADVRVEPQQEELAAPAFHGGARVVEQEHRAGLRLVAGADHRERERRLDDALDQRLDAPAGRLASEQPRLQHARVVEHEQVAGHEQALDVGEREVAQRVARDVQQPARRPFGQRVLRDQVRRQVEVEVVEGEVLCRLHGFTGHEQ